MNIYKLFPSRYVTALDLNGHDVTVTIKIVAMEEMGSQNEEKPVVFFSDAKKGMVLNKTNAMTIADLYGPDTVDWAGKRITVYSAKVKAFGAVHDAIRVRPRIPPKNQTGPAPDEIISEPPHDEGPDLDESGEELFG